MLIILIVYGRSGGADLANLPPNTVEANGTSGGGTDDGFEGPAAALGL
jgi:hypothetical protein